VTDDVLTADEAAKLLRVTTQTVLKESRLGLLPGVKVGREWRYSRRALIRHLEQYVGEREQATRTVVAAVEDRPDDERAASSP
jgi:excisionase family DNA binding protein